MTIRAPLCLLAIVAALLAGLALSGQERSASAQPPAAGGPGAVVPRIATVDIYLLVERILTRPEFKRAQEDLATRWNTRLDALQRELTRLEQDLQTISQNDPRFQAMLRTGREKQDEYERAIQERQSEYETLSSGQLTQAYTEAQRAITRLGEQRGYTHILATRPPSRSMNASTLGNTLQEFLGRPVLKAPAEDDLTEAAAAELKVDLTAEAPAPGSPGAGSPPSAPTGRR